MPDNNKPQVERVTKSLDGLHRLNTSSQAHPMADSVGGLDQMKPKPTTTKQSKPSK